MSVGRRRVWLSLAAIGIIAGAAYLVFGTSEEERVLGLLGELCAAASSQPGDTAASRDRRIRSALALRVTPEVTLSLPELGDVEGSDALAELLSNTGGADVAFAIDTSEVRVEPGKHRARAELGVTLTFRVPGEERKDTRTALVDLVSESGKWRVKRITVAPRPREHPEARP